MMDKFKLCRTKQCSKCPWKVAVDPHTIPAGYDVEKHKALKSTMADPQHLLANVPGLPLKMMACHESEAGHECPCVGWLHHQLGVGNNIPLRMWMMGCENGREIETYGEQHETLEDTFPDE